MVLQSPKLVTKVSVTEGKKMTCHGGFCLVRQDRMMKCLKLEEMIVYSHNDLSGGRVLDKSKVSADTQEYGQGSIEIRVSGPTPYRLVF